MADYEVVFTDTEGEQLERQAKARGYTAVADYVRALIEADALVAALRDDWSDADESPDVLEAELRQSWHDAMTGNTLSLDALRNSLDDES